MTWEELFLSFRVRLSRVPDEYDPVLHGFLALEARDLGSLCDSIREVEAKPRARHHRHRPDPVLDERAPDLVALNTAS